MKKVVLLVVIVAVVLQFLPLLYTKTSHLVAERYGFPFVYFEKQWLAGGMELGVKEDFNVGYLFYDLGIFFIILSVAAFIIFKGKNKKDTSI